VNSTTPPSAGAFGQDSGRLAALRAQPRRPGQASFFFWDAHFRSEAVKVLPGEFYASNEELLVTTTLGSCIAACLWDRQRRVGGMNHFLLPDAGGGNGASGQYGAYAMDLLIGELVKRGAHRSSMEAKIFGGGAVIEGMNAINVGERNTQFVIDYLRTERIQIVSKDVLDIYPRKVCFMPVSGRAMVKKLPPAYASNLRGEQLAVKAPAPAVGGTVDLF
jgi:chemotaxis protein CheD